MATATLCSQMTAATEHGQELLLLQSQMGVMLHFRLRELQGGWTAKTIEFLSDDTVKFDNGAAHGRHSSVVNGITVEFNCKADPLKMKYHIFDRMARTRLFMSSQKKPEWTTFITEFGHLQEPFRLPDKVEFVIVCPDLGHFVGRLKINFVTKEGLINDTIPVSVEIENEQSFSLQYNHSGVLTFSRFQHTKVYWSAGNGKNVVISITE